MKRASFLFVLAVMAVFAHSPISLAGISISPLTTINHSGDFDDGAAEIVAFDPTTERLYVINGSEKTFEIYNLSDPANPGFINSIDVSEFGGVNSIDVQGGIVATAIEGDPVTEPGTVRFYNSAGVFLKSVEVGALPDMVTFTPDGSKVITANEGEPNEDEEEIIDAPGSVSIIDISGGVMSLTQENVTTLGFGDFDAEDLDDSTRIFGPAEDVEGTPELDLEPEFVTVSADSTKAWAVLQENNAIAEIDLTIPEITSVWGLGFKDHSLAGNELDASNDDGVIDIRNWPLLGMYQPDAIANMQIGNQYYIFTANEGDARDFEEADVADITLNATAFPNSAELQMEDKIGNLTITTTMGMNGEGEFTELFSFGGRSFSVFNSSGQLIFDSGSDFEMITGAQFPNDFNSNNDENDSFDNRSDNKGPEPEGIVLGQVDGQTYAFIGLERMGGIMVYNVTDPANSQFVQYINNRDFSFMGDLEADKDGAGDLGPEGLEFVPAVDSPNGTALLIVGNEVSGTTTIYSVLLNSGGSSSGCSVASAAQAATFPVVFLLIPLFILIRRFAGKLSIINR